MVFNAPRGQDGCPRLCPWAGVRALAVGHAAGGRGFRDTIRTSSETP
jgi:hypothetical protein